MAFSTAAVALWTLEREIYGGAQRALWEQLWNLPESAKSVLLIGHNPALQDLALELAHADLNKLPASAGGVVRH